ncbi:hypothetical protein [Streptomyces sp. NPDC057552]|uniref:hypothetical protein n=1 Tax=Streptomyces sp. NPDC057552 TaxID=3350537 RepID=UPI0036B05E47
MMYGVLRRLRRNVRRNVNRKARRALWVWGLLSAAWLVLLYRWDGLARSAETWVSIPLGIAAMTATLMVFVVTYAMLAVQIHLRYSVRLAVSVLDGTAVAYGVFFSAGFVVPGLLAAVPSRGGTLVSLMLFLPVTLSLLPALPFFAARLRTGWLLDRPVTRAVNELGKLEGRKARRPNRRHEAEARCLELCDAAAGVVHAVLAHAGDSLHDHAAARVQAQRLVYALLDHDTARSRASVVRLLDGLTQLAVAQGDARLRSEVSGVLGSTARLARPETGREVFSHALGGLRALGRATGVTIDEQRQLARALSTAVHEVARSLSDSVDPLGVPPLVAPAVRERPARGLQPYRPALLPGRRPNLDLDDVLREGVAGIAELSGRPARPRGDSPEARKRAEAFADGCRLFEELAAELLAAHRWAPYNLVVDHLDEQLRYRLGTGPDRSADLTRRAPQHIPYALELEAAARALTTIADRAFEAGFDAVCRRALESLISGTARAIREGDRTALVLFARELDAAGDALRHQLRGSPEIARTTRVVEIVVSLQPANRALLTELLRLPVPVEHDRFLPVAGDRRDYGEGAETHYREAFRQIIRWALRPLYRTPEGHGSLALAIAGTAIGVLESGGRQQVRFKAGDGAGTGDGAGAGAWSDAVDTDVLRREAYVLNTWRVDTFSHDPHTALLHAVREDEDVHHPGLTVRVAAARWRIALEAAATGLGAHRYGRNLLADLASGSGGYTGTGLSPEAGDFLARLRSWAEAPWRPTEAAFFLSPWLRDRDDPLVPLLGTSIRPADDADDAGPAEPAPLATLLLHRQAYRFREILRAGGGNRSRAELQAAGLLWGDWPPPSGCPDVALDGGRRGSDDLFAARPGAFWPGSWAERERRADRTYHARTSGGHRIVVVEPDGSSRVLSGPARTEEPFSLSDDTVPRLLTADLLGDWAACPSCHGGSAEQLLPGWCENCRGERTHPGLHRAYGAVHTVLARYGTEWDISRTEFLNAMVAPRADRRR